MPPNTERRPFAVPSWLMPLFRLVTSDSNRPYTRQPGKGVARAKARLAQHRANFAYVDMSPIPTRQQRRAAERANVRGGLHNMKMAALRSGKMGGAAACR